MVDRYTGPARQRILDGGTVNNYLGSIINLAADRFKAIGSDASKLFFMFLDTNSGTCTGTTSATRN